MRIFFYTAALSVGFIGSALAQSGFVVQQPGQPPTYVDRSPTGGYTIKTPGEPTQYMNENHDGSFTVQNPGYPNSPPIYITPQNRSSQYGDDEDNN